MKSLIGRMLDALSAAIREGRVEHTFTPITPSGYMVTDVLAYGWHGKRRSACVQATDGTEVAIWWLPLDMLYLQPTVAVTGS